MIWYFLLFKIITVQLIKTEWNSVYFLEVLKSFHIIFHYKELHNQLHIHYFSNYKRADTYSMHFLKPLHSFSLCGSTFHHLVDYNQINILDIFYFPYLPFHILWFLAWDLLLLQLQETWFRAVQSLYHTLRSLRK